LGALVVICAVLVAGCSRNGNTEKEPAKLTVLCGGSFRPPMEELVAAFEEQTGIPAELSFGQSEDLLPMVKVREEGDLFVSHDPYLDYVDEAGALLGAAQIGYVSPVVVVAKDNPAGVESLDDLAKPGVKVALPNPEFSTCGQMLFKLLEKKGIKDDVLANAEGAIFRLLTRHGHIGERLASQGVARVVKRTATAVGLDPAQLSGHSLRAGLATAAAKAGKSERAIMNQTGHRSVAMVRRYIRDADLFTENAAAGLL